MSDKILFRILIILTIFWAIVVYGLSNQIRVDSKAISGKVVETIIKLMPEAKRIEYEDNSIKFRQLHGQVRKAAHFTLYFIGGIIVTAFVCTSNMKISKVAIFSSLFGILYACADEFHQYFVTGRGAQLSDVVIDSVGFILAEMLILAVLLYKRRKVNE